MSHLHEIPKNVSALVAIHLLIRISLGYLFGVTVMTIQVTLTQNQWQVWQAAQMTIDKANALIDRSCKFPLEALPSEILAEGKVTEVSYTHQRSHMVLNWVTPQAALTNIMVLMNAALDGHSNKDDVFAIVLPVFDDVQVLTSVGPSFMASSRLRTGHDVPLGPSAGWSPPDRSHGQSDGFVFHSAGKLGDGRDRECVLPVLNNAMLIAIFSKKISNLP